MNQPTLEFDSSYADEQLRRSRHPLRRVVKGLYLQNLLADVSGPTIDFGCGAGQLLERLPAGSTGIEINPHLTNELRRRGLNVVQGRPGVDPFAFDDIPAGRYETLVLSHVLEHFADAQQVLRRLLRRCGELGIGRLILVLPGLKGYHSDATHKTFVDRRYLTEHGLLSCEGYTASSLSYFPGNVEAIGRHFVFHEMKVVYRRDAS